MRFRPVTPLPPLSVRPPPGFGDAEWAESEREAAAAAAAAEAAGVEGRDEVAHARRLAEVLEERLRLFRLLGEEDEDEDDPYDPYGVGSEYADGDEGESGYYYGGGGGSSDG
jgi:hypothetical protein